jgi:GNAT superfamily N-acetyltransferase
MSVQLKEVTTRRDLKQFIRFPYRHYRNSPHWIPPLISGEMTTLSSAKNPAFEHCEVKFLLAFRDGKPAGRIAGIINHRFVEQWQRKDARFCWFETVNDREVSGKLLGAVEEWARSRGMERIIGPMGFTTFERQGILVKGFEEMPTFSGVYNYSYYPEHLEAHGYGKEIDYVEYEVKVPGQIPDKAVKIRDLIVERYQLRSLGAHSTKEMLPYADSVFRVINEAYEPLYGFTKLTEKQIDYFVKRYFSFIKPDYVTAVLDKKDRVLGFQISVPSLSRAFRKAKGRLFPFGWYHITRAMKNPERIDILLVGVLPEYQSKGINSIFMTDLTRIAIERGIKYAESNSELEENVKVQNFWRYFDTRQHRRSRIYGKVLA